MLLPGARKLAQLGARGARELAHLPPSTPLRAKSSNATEDTLEHVTPDDSHVWKAPGGFCYSGSSLPFVSGRKISTTSPKRNSVPNTEMA